MVQRFVLLRQLAIEKPLKCDDHPLKVIKKKHLSNSIYHQIVKLKINIHHGVILHCIWKTISRRFQKSKKNPRYFKNRRPWGVHSSIKDNLIFRRIFPGVKFCNMKPKRNRSLIYIPPKILIHCFTLYCRLCTFPVELTKKWWNHPLSEYDKVDIGVFSKC